MMQCAVCLAVILIASVGIYMYMNKYIILYDDYHHIYVDSTEVLTEVDEKFLSVALDISFMRCWFHKFNESDWRRLEELSSLLAPAYLRLGGNDADRTIFKVNTTTDKWFLWNDNCKDFSDDTIIITGGDWKKLNKFIHNSGLDLILDLNVLLRKHGEWDSTNAWELIKFSEENGFPMDFQLGNEPNAFPHAFNISITAPQLAGDFYKLRYLLNSTKAYQESKLIGPDVTRPKTLQGPSLEFLEEFLVEEDVVDVVSWHQYYLNGRTATLEDFIDPEVFERLPFQIESISNVVRHRAPTLPIWISETGSAYGGGAPRLSNRFVASFLWLDKLGVAARSNMSVVIRQSLFKNHYALITEQFMPTSDFWISLLYKKLVGREVLSVKLSDNSNSKFLRFYGHCLASNSTLNGSIVIYGMNLGNQTELVVPKGIAIVYPVYSYIFRGEFQNLKAKGVLLNDKLLVYNRTNVQDVVKMGKEVEYPLVIPGHSIAFWVLNETTKSSCRRRRQKNYTRPLRSFWRKWKDKQSAVPMA